MRPYLPPLAFAAIAFLIICSCTSSPRPAKTVTYSEVLVAAKPNLQNTLITSAYYCGSKDGFDYFVVYPPLGREERYRVAEGESRVVARFPFTIDQEHWRVWPPTSYPTNLPGSLLSPQESQALHEPITNSPLGR